MPGARDITLKGEPISGSEYDRARTRGLLRLAIHVSLQRAGPLAGILGRLGNVSYWFGNAADFRSQPG